MLHSLRILRARQLDGSPERPPITRHREKYPYAFLPPEKKFKKLLQKKKRQTVGRPKVKREVGKGIKSNARNCSWEGAQRWPASGGAYRAAP